MRVVGGGGAAGTGVCGVAFGYYRVAAVGGAVEEGAERPEGLQPGTSAGEVLQVNAGEGLLEESVNVFYIHKGEVGVFHCPGAFFGKAEHDGADTFGGQVSEGGLEVPAVGGGDDNEFEVAFGEAEGEVLQHVVVDVAVGGFFGFGEDGEADVAEGVDPGVDAVDVGFVDVGEEGGFADDAVGVEASVGGKLGGLLEEPEAGGVEARALVAVGASANDGREPHVHVGGVPDKEGARAGGATAHACLLRCR